MEKQSKTKLSPGSSTKDNNLKRPDQIRTGDKRHKCQHCSYTCRYNCLLKIHERVHTGEKPFNCRHCSFKTAYKSCWKFHEKNHKGEKPFECRYCPFKTAQNYSLKRHERWHTKERPHKCLLCPFSAVLRCRLEIHERNHTGEKVFKCRYCSFKSPYKCGLKRHERVHTGDKPFKCQHCPYVAIRNSQLIRHEKKHSGEGPFKCQRCNYSSTQIFHVSTHEKIHTRGYLGKLEDPAKLRRSLSPQKRLQSRRKSLRSKIPSDTTTVLSEKCTKIYDLDSSRKQDNKVPSHLEDLLEGEEEFCCQDSQLDSSDDQEIYESFSQVRFEMFICKECNYALFSEKELCMHYTFCHKLPVVSLNIERTYCTIEQ